MPRNTIFVKTVQKRDLNVFYLSYQNRIAIYKDREGQDGGEGVRVYTAHVEFEIHIEHPSEDVGQWISESGALGKGLARNINVSHQYKDGIQSHKVGQKQGYEEKPEG